MTTLLHRIGKLLASIVLAVSGWLSSGAVLAANNDPIVLVHGFLGFGPHELQGTGFKYWGGFNDIEAYLRTNNGSHQVFTATVGPVSSNWDRAVELYYQIKGGCVDYGAARTKQFAGYGKIQKPSGKCWAADPNNNPNHDELALYPQWDENHPIHLISHSQGGQTVRTLIELLENGSPYANEGDSPLYAGGKIGWVKSATTISTPHNGTTLREVIISSMPKMPELIGLIIQATGLGGSNNPVYNFKLEQYGLEHTPSKDKDSENIKDFINRTKAAPFWKLENRDSGLWEVGPDGARELNSWVKTSPNVYYYSIANHATEQGCFFCRNDTDRLIAPFQRSIYQYARDDMIFFLKDTAGGWVVPSFLRSGMGSYTQTDPSRVQVNDNWFINDGAVNYISMKAPFGQPVRSYDGNSIKGYWNYLGYYDNYDHLDVMGWQDIKYKPPIYPIYDYITNILYGL